MSVSTKTVWLSKPQDFTTEWAFSVEGRVNKINMASPFYGYSIVIRNADSETLNDVTNNNALSTGVSTTAYGQIIIEFDNYKNTALQDIENPHISILHTSLHHINELVTVPLHQTLDRDFKIDVFYKNGDIKVVYNNRIIINQTLNLSSYLSSSSLVGFTAYTEDTYNIHLKSMNFKNKIEPYYSKWGAYPLEIGMELSSHAFSATGFEYLIRIPRTTHNLELVELDDPRIDIIEPPSNVVGVHNHLLSQVALTWDAMEGYDAFIVIRDGLELGYAYSNSFTDTNVLSGTFVYRVVALKAGGMLSKSSDPITVNTVVPIIFNHMFLSGNALDDTSTENNDYVENIDNNDPSYLYEHQFFGNLEDSLVNPLYEYNELNTDVFSTENGLFEHEFIGNLEDSTLSNNDYVESSTTVTPSRDVVINANTVANFTFDYFSIKNKIDNTHNAQLFGTFTDSFVYGSIAGDTTKLNMTDNYTYFELPTNPDIEGEVVTVDIALKFLNLKTTNVICTQYNVASGVNVRRFYLDYYNPSQSFRLSVHTPNNNGNDYIQYNIPYTLLTNTDYLISLAIDTFNDLISLNVNKATLALSYVGGNHTNINQVNWTTPANCPIYLGAYRNTAGFNNGGNDDMNSYVYRFTVHKEYRTLSTHNQSYDNLFV